MGSNDDVLVPTIKHSTYVVCVCEISLLFYYPGLSEDLKILGQKLIKGHLKEIFLSLKANVSEEILSWHSLRHSHSADICILFYCQS